MTTGGDTWDGTNPGKSPDLTDLFQLAEQTEDSERIINRNDSVALREFVNSHLDNELRGLAVYNESLVEIHHYPVEQLARYSREELAAICDDLILRASIEDIYQEDLYLYGDLNFTLQGFEDMQQLRIRCSNSTGVIVLFCADEVINIPRFVNSFYEAVDINIQESS